MRRNRPHSKIGSFVKRFYKAVSYDAATRHVMLDGKPIRTPAGNTLAALTDVMGQVIADEWAAQAEQVLPDTMPVTQFLITMIDGVAGERALWEQRIHDYLDGDMLLYPCGEPAALDIVQKSSFAPFVAAYVTATAIALPNAQSLQDTKRPQAAHAALDGLLAPMSDVGVFVWQYVAGECVSTILGWHAVLGNAAINEIVNVALLEEWFHDRLASPDGSNPDPMLEKRTKMIRAALDAARAFYRLSEA